MTTKPQLARSVSSRAIHRVPSRASHFRHRSLSASPVRRSRPAGDDKFLNGSSPRRTDQSPRSGTFSRALSGAGTIMLASIYTSTDHLALAAGHRHGSICLWHSGAGRCRCKTVGTSRRWLLVFGLAGSGSHRCFVLAAMVGHAREWRLSS